MNYVDIFSSIVIAVAYNIVIHQLVQCVFKSYSYEDRMNYGIATIFIAGLVGIVLSKIILSENESIYNSIISMGLLIGGIFLVATTIIVNWDNITDDIKLFVTLACFGGLLYYSYKKQKK